MIVGARIWRMAAECRLVRALAVGSRVRWGKARYQEMASHAVLNESKDLQTDVFLG